jgi:3-methyladenine DNA glycosylase AlkC
MERKGASTTGGVPKEVRELLAEGLIETRNLSEWLVVDQGRLAERVLGDLGWDDLVRRVVEGLAGLEVSTAPKRLALIGRVLSEGLGTGRERRRGYEELAGHGSDVVRSWACHLVGMGVDLSLGEKLEWMRRLAGDGNMSVREVAWMAMREPLMMELELGLELLAGWSEEGDANLRRFGSELTRPRGVWCRHIAELKEEPEKGLPILEPLRSDGSKYVRDSVANWLNDASKTRPEWVRGVCGRWLEKSGTRETGMLVRRAMRTIGG